MLEKLKALLIQMASYLSIYELGVLLGIFFIFIMFFTLGLLLRGRRFIARFFFFLSILTIFSTPFALQAVMQKVFYKIEVEITSAYPMQYTKGFFVAGKITHRGKVPINECLISVDLVRDEKGSQVIKVFNTLFPKRSFSTIHEVDIGLHQSADFAVIVPNFEAKEAFFRVYVDCYLSNKFTQKMQKPKQQSADIITPREPAPASTKDTKEEYKPQEQ